MTTTRESFIIQYNYLLSPASNIFTNQLTYIHSLYFVFIKLIILKL